MKKIIALLLAICLAFSLSSTVFANDLEGEAPDTEITIEEYGSGFFPICYGEGDILGYTGWVTLMEAVSYYGEQWTYVYCGGTGSPYNYYYTFSDGTHMFFGVTSMP